MFSINGAGDISMPGPKERLGIFSRKGGDMRLFGIGIVLALVLIGMGNGLCAADLNGIWKSVVRQ